VAIPEVFSKEWPDEDSGAAESRAIVRCGGEVEKTFQLKEREMVRKMAIIAARRN